MNNVITFPNAKAITTQKSLTELIEYGLSRFEELKAAKLFHPDSEWEHGSWKYRANGGERVLFAKSTDEHEANELISCLKCKVIEILYDNRLKGSLPTLVGRTQGFRKLIQLAGITTLGQLNQNAYDTFAIGIRDASPRTQSGWISQCNAQIRWLEKHHLLVTPIDAASPPVLSSLPAIPAKLPSRDLIQCLLEARWKIAENEEDTLQWANDMVSVLAQSFQYGMGLRIGETLRLPKDPIKYVDGKMFFIVWTEKGKPPIARYIPTEWQEVFEASIQEIQRITEPYRNRAIELETTGRLSEVVDALEQFRVEKEKDFELKLAKLSTFLEEKTDSARQLWAANMRGDIKPDRYYSVAEVQQCVPEQVTCDKYANRLARQQFEKCGIPFEVDPTDTGRYVKYRTKGQAVLDAIDREIAFRNEHITDLELLSILHERDFNWDPKENSILAKYSISDRGGGSFKRFTVRGQADCAKRGTIRKVLTRENAEKVLREYCLGGYDYKNWIDIGSFNRLFLGEIFHSETSITQNAKDRRILQKSGLKISAKKHRICRKTRSTTLWRYQASITYLIEQESIHEFLLQRFKDANLNAEAEIYTDSLEMDESTNNALAVRIDSRSFQVMQKVSEHLMLTGKTNNGGGQSFVPTIIGYRTLVYSFVGGGRYNYPGLFERYGITADKKLISEFQTHKGRHWKTTSLFRSGVSSELINLWMGRDANQGSQYDHRTDRERAELVKAAMKADSARFVGHVAAKLRHFEENKLDEEHVDDFLTQELVAIHHSDQGMCKRELALKPCEISMHCLSGKDGKGCKDYLIDLADVGQIERLAAWADREKREIARLEQQKNMGIVAAQSHLDARAPVFKNASMILETHKLRESLEDGVIRPFYLEGSNPDDCPFECGE